MRQGEGKDRLDINNGHGLRTVKRGMGATRAYDRQIGAQGLDVVFGDPRRGVVQHLSRDRHARNPRLCGGQRRRHRLLVRPPGSVEGFRVSIECQAPFEHLAPQGHV